MIAATAYKRSGGAIRQPLLFLPSVGYEEGSEGWIRGLMASLQEQVPAFSAFYGQARQLEEEEQSF